MHTFAEIDLLNARAIIAALFSRIAKGPRAYSPDPYKTGVVFRLNDLTSVTIGEHHSRDEDARDHFANFMHRNIEGRIIVEFDHSDMDVQSGFRFNAIDLTESSRADWRVVLAGAAHEIKSPPQAHH